MAAWPMARQLSIARIIFGPLAISKCKALETE